MAQIFKKLTPINDADIEQAHIDAMNFVIEDKDVLNVAVSGNYGSGKSSFIETYKEKFNNKKKTFLHISLAHFNSEDGNTEKQQSNSGADKAAPKDNILEGKIVNQLLHQIDAEKIPLTIFKSKQHPKKRQIWGWFILLTTLLLSMLVLWIFPSLSWKSWVKQALVIILVISFSVLIYQLTKLQFHRKLFKTISFKGASVSGEIEIFGKSDASYFDKYLDDVLYLFDNCQSDIIVFEDIDRFETNLIFSKLKEINTLVNNKRKARGEDKKLLFMYLVKDEMFISKERTKFFDFIIPIIPAVTSSNSREKFSEILADLGCKEDFKGSFLQKISIYIDDMRLASNICNEYILYKNNLTGENSENKLKLSNEKLFAMIVYKNIFPKDFSELQVGSGFIHRLFQEKDNLKKEKLSSLEEQISKLREKISNVESEILKDKLELYSSNLKIPEGKSGIRVNGKYEGDFPNRLDFIEEILKSEAEIETFVVINDYSIRKQSIDSKDVFPISDSNFKYRLNNIENKSNLQQLNSELEDLLEEKSKIQHQKLANLITREKINSIADEEELKYIKNNPQFSMIIFLIRNGYIDESYPDYITYFYPNSLNREDKEFIMAVQGEEKLPWDYHLTNLGEIHNRLDTSDFEQEEILNYNLFAYTMTQTSVPDREKRLSSYFTEKRLDFIISFFKQVDITGQINTVFDILKYNPELLNLLWTSDRFLDEEKFTVFQRLLFFADLPDEELSDKYSKLISDVVSHNWLQIWEEYLSTGENKDEQKIKKNLNFLNVQIVEFGFKNEYSSINEAVYENNLYQLNVKNLSDLLLYLDPTLNENDIKHRNFSIINSDDKFAHLLNYVKENMEDYVKIIVEQSDGVIKDDVEYIYEILNNEDISDETKTEYLTCVDDTILSLSEINDMPMIDEAVKLNKAIFDTKNVLDYFAKYDTWNELLIDFVNSKDIFNIDRKVFKERDEELQRVFFEATVKCNNLENRHYKAILSSLGWYYNSVPEEIDADKIDILIETGVISKEFETTILSNLRDSYPASVIKYILKYLDGYIEVLDNIYDKDEILEVLNQDIPFEKAQILVDKFNGSISIKDKKYNPSLLAYVIENKFDDTDLPMLLEEYQIFDNLVQKVIFQKAKSDIEIILSNAYPVDKNLLLLLIKDNNIDLDKRRLLYSRNIPHDSVEEILGDLRFLDLFEEYQQIIQKTKENKNPKVSSAEYNENLLSFLKNKGCFNSFEEDSHDSNYYRIYSFRKIL
ncbi:YobI family P-loop NTPase [Streptococcus mutans]|uniref:YobI family P-loop NTPase n=3 Tax=Streptococcus mutans TaxID=1309 RepID=UPI0002B5F288|nr:hypothetical protein [Streptococcus mutans]EMC00139.1 hypothetical protein SMU66_05234 [Streptococcus mutans N34]MBT3147595.1 hypothetical protein [Streptococcus mutans]MBW3478967.1 hypothetical protein [Streptococcus mutans]MDW8508748.1 hypothetical protein [Streptococcus mutans]NLR02693.1 hypothetical protein [Streptococcus mutans]